MPDAVIVVANERHFSERARSLKDYLRRRCRMHVVIDVPAWNRAPEQVESALLYRIATSRQRPLLIAYIGHGAGPEDGFRRHGWIYGLDAGKGLFFSYPRLLRLLRHREGPTVLLNDCCRAGALNEALGAGRPTRHPIAAISASRMDGYSYGDLTETVIDSWRRREIYVPKIRPRGGGRKHPVEEVRSGPALDHLFFPREP
jgi:hypothetical protein